MVNITDESVNNSASLIIVITPPVPNQPHVLPTIPECAFCAAKRFPREPPGFCCSSGQVRLAARKTPEDLWNLFTGVTPLSKEFKTYVRTYNNNFAFTSLGVKCDLSLCRRNNGIYTFKAQGQMHHFIGSLLPVGPNPSHLQLYFYDTDHEVENRLRTSDRMNAPLVNLILQILNKNPYSQFFRSLSDLPDITECQIILKNTASLDQRVYNAPTASQVAAIWVEGGDEEVTARDIIVFSKPGVPMRIWYYYACYDSLQYPLLFPLGEPGWHQGIKRFGVNENVCVEEEILPSIITAGNVEQFLQEENRVMNKQSVARQTISCREYYCYILQMRPEKSLPLVGGRLTQQYVVDMYIK